MSFKNDLFCPLCYQKPETLKPMAITRGKLEKSKAGDNRYFCHSCGINWEIADGKLIQKSS